MAGRQKRLDARKRRRSKKIARKAAKRALYEQWKREGRNTKSKRVKLRAARLRKKTVRLVSHKEGPCGNIGCKLCNPIPQNLRTPAQLQVMQ
jgi:hypothetical protein